MRYSSKKAVTAAVCALLTAMGTGAVFAEEYSDSLYTRVSVYPEEINCLISPYIYGVNDADDLNGTAAAVIRQHGSELSSYNWETNYSTYTRDGVCSNGVSLIEHIPDEQWGTPALYTEQLAERAAENNIPVKLATLQLMGYAANDGMGTVKEGTAADRFARMMFSKRDSYLNVPNISDNTVYIDEYAAYLVNKYGTVEEGGFNGYFLDSEPDLWNDNYPVLELGELDPDELIQRSSELAASLKIIDGSALVFGPSLSGISAAADLNGSFVYDDTFIEYYLSEMKKAGTREKTRLLDVLDIHYKTAPESDSARMQAPRALWDSSYSEDNDTYEKYGEYMPLLPYLNNAVSKSYPGTKISLSEYSFGGGDNISGCIAETDALGKFGENGVYLACLLPDEVWEFQKAAVNLYRNYDHRGSRTGNISVRTTVNDMTSSCFASTDETDTDKLWTVLTNKNLYSEKTIDVNIISERDYELAEMYTISGKNSRIMKKRSLPDISESGVVLEPSSVCLLVFRTEDAPVTSESDTETALPDNEDVSSEGEITEETVPDPVKETIDIITEATLPAEVTDSTETSSVPGENEDTSPTETSAPKEEESSDNSESGIAAEDDEAPEPGEAEEREFPLFLKVTVIFFTVCCVGAIVYVLIFQK